MSRLLVTFFALGLGLGCLAAADSAAALTVEEATALSQQTGRPIFAVAGSET